MRTSPMYGIGSPPQKYKDTSLALRYLSSPTPKSYGLLIREALKKSRSDCAIWHKKNLLVKI